MSVARREERLSKRTLSDHTVSLPELADKIKNNAPYISFAFLLGSAQDGFVRKGADIDIAVFFDRKKVKITFDSISNVISIVEKVCPFAECDLEILNDAGPIYRFEALKSARLFVREDKIADYAEFYSLTCREYEETIAGYRRYHAILNSLNV